MSLRSRGIRASAAAAALLVAAGMAGHVVAQSGVRSISIYNIHTKETVTAVFKRGAKYDAAGLEKINHIMRDHRQNEPARMDPALVDLLWEMHQELGSKEPIHLISGFRSRKTNDMLRRTVGGQASESRHILGKAADVHFPDVPIKTLRYSALVQEKGGVGYYPTSALPFVHVDTDRVRSWPRLPRTELALLFPSGATQHMPASGGAITIADVRAAQAGHRSLAQQVAAFHASRAGGGLPTAVAEAGQPRTARVAAAPRIIEPAQPGLAERPRQALMPASLTPPLGITSADRTGLEQLAAASLVPQLVSGPVPARRPAMPNLASSGLPAPPPAIRPAREPQRQVAAIDGRALAEGSVADIGRFGWGIWVPAPAYDDEHPEELSYRPFPITPYLTESERQPVMHELVAHDVARTVELIDQADTAPALHFRPAAEMATALWAQQFTGSAMGGDRLQAARSAASGSGLKNRVVRTSGR